MTLEFVAPRTSPPIDAEQVMPAVPQGTMIKRLVDCPADCRAENIRTLIWGGAPMYVEDAIAALDRFGDKLVQLYGQGESPMTITADAEQYYRSR